MRELNNYKKKLIDEKEKFTTFVKEKMNSLEAELKESTTTKEQLREDVMKLEKQLVSVSNEREKLKQKITKLKNRRNVDLDQKICKNCGREYLQNENFNWSCRTHRSDWGGEMWWCCGKSKKEAPGCKYAKHETKDDEEEEKVDQQDDKNKLKHLKCICCKETGHLAKDCQRDPNIRTSVNAQEEIQRIDKFKEYKRYNADTFQNTTKLFELLAKEKMPVIYEETISDVGNTADVQNTSYIGGENTSKAQTFRRGSDFQQLETNPIQTRGDLEDDDDLNNDQTKTGDGSSPNKRKRKRKFYKETAFKGYGLMKFDDFNYSALNKVVFQIPKHAATGPSSPTLKDENDGGLEPGQNDNYPKNDDVADARKESYLSRLSEQNLLGRDHNQSQDDDGRRESIAPFSTQKTRKLYNEDEIQNLRNYQQQDLYEDILDLKNMTLIENMKQKNLIDIDFHYKNQVDLMNRSKGAKSGPMSRRSGQTRSQAKQSDDNSQIFSSFNKDNNEPSPNKRPSSTGLANINSLMVRDKMNSGNGHSSHSNKNVFFGNLPPEMRNMTKEQIMSSPLGQIYQQVMEYQKLHKSSMEIDNDELLFKSNGTNSGGQVYSSNDNLNQSQKYANNKSSLRNSLKQQQPPVMTKKLSNSQQFEIKVKEMNQFAPNQQNIVKQQQNDMLRNFSNAGGGGVQLQEVNIQQLQQDRMNKKINKQQMLQQQQQELDGKLPENSGSNKVQGSKTLQKMYSLVSSGTDKQILVENLDHSAPRQSSLQRMKDDGLQVPESPLIHSPTFSMKKGDSLHQLVEAALETKSMFEMIMPSAAITADTQQKQLTSKTGLQSPNKVISFSEEQLTQKQQATASKTSHFKRLNDSKKKMSANSSTLQQAQDQLLNSSLVQKRNSVQIQSLTSVQNLIQIQQSQQISPHQMIQKSFKQQIVNQTQDTNGVKSSQQEESKLVIDQSSTKVIVNQQSVKKRLKTTSQSQNNQHEDNPNQSTDSIDLVRGQSRSPGGKQVIIIDHRDENDKKLQQRISPTIDDQGNEIVSPTKTKRGSILKKSKNPQVEQNTSVDKDLQNQMQQEQQNDKNIGQQSKDMSALNPKNNHGFQDISKIALSKTKNKTENNTIKKDKIKQSKNKNIQSNDNNALNTTTTNTSNEDKQIRKVSIGKR